MKATQEERKQKAIETLVKLGNFPQYKEAFRRSNKLTYYINGIGYYIDEDTSLYLDPEYKGDEKLLPAIREFEERYNATVYAVIHSDTEFGELWDLLYIPEERDEWDCVVSDYDKRTKIIWSYCLGEYAEFGDIGVQQLFGGFRRAW